MSTNPHETGTIVFATYRVQEGKEAEFKELLVRHWPTLRDAGLVTSDPPRFFQGRDESGKWVIVEVFEWKDAAAPGIAHDTPAVMAIWEPMGALVEERLGRPQFEFPHYERFELDLAAS